MAVNDVALGVVLVAAFRRGLEARRVRMHSHVRRFRSLGAPGPP
jgi:hypothetical protein